MSREDDSQALVLQFRGLQEIIMIGKERNVEAILNAEVRLTIIFMPSKGHSCCCIYKTFAYVCVTGALT